MARLSAIPRPALLAAVLVGMAVALCFAFLQYRTNFITYRIDGTVSRSVESDPVFPLGMRIFDLGCFVGLPCTDSAIHHIDGIYARGNLSRTAGIVGGLVAPYALLCIAGYVAFLRAAGITRMIIASALIGIAAVLLAPLCIAAYNAFPFEPNDVPLANLIAVLVVIFTAGAGGTLLLTTRHTGSGSPE